MKRVQNLKFTKQNVFILFVVVLILILTALFLASQKKYKAQSHLIIDQELFLELRNKGDYLIPSPIEFTVGEIQELLNTDTFIRLMILNTGLELKMQLGDKVVRQTIVDVRDSIEIMKSADDEIEIQVTWTDEITAGQVANSLVKSFIAWKDRSDQRDSLPVGEFLERLVPQYEQEYLVAVSDLDAFLTEHPEPIFGERSKGELMEIDRLMQVVEVTTERYQASSENLERIRLEEEAEELDLSRVYSARLYVFEDTPNR